MDQYAGTALQFGDVGVEIVNPCVNAALEFCFEAVSVWDEFGCGNGAAGEFKH